MSANNTIRNVVQDSLPLLQHADANFTKNTACISCHNNDMEAMAVGLARKRGFRIDEATASAQVRFNGEALEAIRDKMHQGYVIPEGDFFSDFILGYRLLGLHAENYKPDLNTDAAAMLIQSRQKPDGEWPFPHADPRPPLCLDYITQTALAMRALQFYAPRTAKAACEKSIRLAASWLANAHSLNNVDRTWRLIGLAWAGTDRATKQNALREVLASQRSDGGWSDLPSMQSTPYATGTSLVALQTAGLPVSDPAYKRGVDYLLSSQQEDGSWFTKTRALGFQPYFDGSFPHSYDQWMSPPARVGPRWRSPWLCPIQDLLQPRYSRSWTGHRGACRHWADPQRGPLADQIVRRILPRLSQRNRCETHRPPPQKREMHTAHAQRIYFFCAVPTPAGSII